MESEALPDAAEISVSDRMSLRFRWWTRAWAVAALVHLTLPDVRQWSWLIPNVLLASAALRLLYRPTAPPCVRGWIWWSVGVVGLAWPLLFGGDQLTQSVLLLLMALAVLLCARGADDRSHARAIRWLTIVAYGAAAFHKLNRDFLNPAVSCATGGVRLLGENWSLPLDWGAVAGVWPVAFLVAEVSVVCLFALRPRWAIPLALTLHVPLTIVFAPAFAWVMVAGYPCFFDDAGLRDLTTTMRVRGEWIFGVASMLAATDAALYFRAHWIVYPAWQLTEAGVWFLWVIGWAAVLPLSSLRHRREPMTRRRRDVLSVALPLVFLAQACIPYFGLQFHHAAAMLSNLRIDRGCWNHLVVPERMRRREPYVRIEEAASGGEVSAPDALATMLRERLWSVEALRDSIAQACREGASPLRLRGSGPDGRLWSTEDACETLPVPQSTAWRGFTPLQQNLERECPQRCIH